MRVVALIPARGGSKGIPRKNLQRVGGRPLVVRSIEHALWTRRIDATFVSTDDEGIAAVSRAAGARIIRRPADIAGDTASTESAVAHALRELAAMGESPEIIVLLQCTSPFRSPGQLEAALEQFERTNADSMLSVTPFVGFLWRRDENGAGVPVNYDPHNRPRRQDVRNAFLETGSFYIFRRSLFESTGSRLGGRMETFEVPENDALEIDDPDELDLARRQAQARGDVALTGAGAVRWLVLDVDGTLTDGAMYYGEDGSEFKRFDTRDGMGLARWRAAGGRVAFITGENSRAAERRAHKLGVDHLTLGCHDKATAIRELMEAHGLLPEHVLAMGDDLNDLPMADEVGWFVAPAGARPEVAARADLVTQAQGGHGAVRELVELLLPLRTSDELRRAG